MEIGKIQQNSPNANFKAKIKYNAAIKENMIIYKNLLYPEIESIGRPSDTVQFILSGIKPKKSRTDKRKQGYTRTLKVTANLFDSNKIDKKCTMQFKNRKLGIDDCSRIISKIDNYIQSLIFESNKLKDGRLEELANKPFAEFSIANPRGWSYISNISFIYRDKYDNLLKAHFIAELANKAEKEINKGASVEHAIEIALNQLKKSKEYYMSATDIKSAREALDDVWKYGKKAQNTNA